MYRAAVGNSVDRIELKEILLFVFLFWAKNSYLFPIFLATVIPIFLFSKCHLSLDTLGSRGYLFLIDISRRSNFPFRKQAMPFSQLLEKFLTLNKFFSTKLKKKEIM